MVGEATHLCSGSWESFDDIYSETEDMPVEFSSSTESPAFSLGEVSFGEEAVNDSFNDEKVNSTEREMPTIQHGIGKHRYISKEYGEKGSAADNEKESSNRPQQRRRSLRKEDSAKSVTLSGDESDPLDYPPSPRRDGREVEVDCKRNPTQLFLRMNYRLWDMAIAQIEFRPSEASVWIVSRNAAGVKKWRNLPIHLACLHCPEPSPLVLMNALIDAYPRGVQRRNSEGKLPLHLACENMALIGNGSDGEDAFLSLINAYPESVGIPDDAGRLPVDILKDNGIRVDIEKSRKDSIKGGSIMYLIRKRMAKSHNNDEASREYSRAGKKYISVNGITIGKSEGLAIKKERKKNLLLRKELDKMSQENSSIKSQTKHQSEELNVLRDATNNVEDTDLQRTKKNQDEALEEEQKRLKDETIHNLMNKLKLFESRLDKAEAENKVMKTSIEELTQEKTHLEARLNKACQDAEKKQDKLCEVTKSHAEVVEELTQEKTHLEARLNKACQDAEEKQDKLTKSHAEVVEELTQEKTHLEARLNKACQDAEEKQHKLCEVTKSHADVVKMMKSLRDENAKLQLKPETTEIVLVKNESEVEKISKAMEEQTSKIDTLTSTNQLLVSKNSALEESVLKMANAYEEKVNELENERHTLSGHLENAVNDKIQVDKRIKELVADKESLLLEKKALHDVTKQLKEKNKESEENLAKTVGEMNKLLSQKDELAEDLFVVTSNFKELQQEMQSLENKKDELRNNQSLINTEKEKIRERDEKMTKEKDALKHEMKKLVEAYASSQRKNADLFQKIQLMESKDFGWKNELKIAHLRKKEQEQIISKLQEIVKEKDDRITTLEKAMERSKEEMIQLAKAESEAKCNASEIYQTNIDISRNLQKLESDNNDLKRQVDEVHESSNVNKKSIADLKKQMETKDDNITSLETTIDTMKKENEKLQAESAHFRMEAKSHAERHRSLLNTQDELKADIQSLENARSTLTSELAASVDKLERLESVKEEKHLLEEETYILEEEICKLQKRCEELDAAEESLNEENMSLRETIASLKSELTDNDEKARAASEQFEVHRNDSCLKIEALSTTRSELELRVSASEQKEAELMSEVDNWQRKSQDLSDELDNWQKMCKEKSEKINSLEMKICSLSEKLDSQLHANDELKTKLSCYNQMREAGNDNLISLKERNELLAKDLTDCQDKLHDAQKMLADVEEDANEEKASSESIICEHAAMAELTEINCSNLVEIRCLTEETEALKSQNNILQKMCKEKDEKVKSLELKTCSLSEELGTQSYSNDELKAELSRYRDTKEVDGQNLDAFEDQNGFESIQFKSDSFSFNNLSELTQINCYNLMEIGRLIEEKKKLTAQINKLSRLLESVGYEVNSSQSRLTAETEDFLLGLRGKHECESNSIDLCTSEVERKPPHEKNLQKDESIDDSVESRALVPFLVSRDTEVHYLENKCPPLEPHMTCTEERGHSTSQEISPMKTSLNNQPCDSLQLVQSRSLETSQSAVSPQTESKPKESNTTKPDSLGGIGGNESFLHRQKLAAYKEKLTKAIDVCRSFQTENERLTGANTALKAKATHLEEVNMSYNAEVAMLKKELSKYTALAHENVPSNQLIEGEDTVLNTLKMEIRLKEEAHESEMKEMQNIHTALKTKNAELQEQAKERSKMFMSLKKRIEKLSKNRDLETIREEERTEENSMESLHDNQRHIDSSELSTSPEETREPATSETNPNGKEPNAFVSCERISLDQADFGINDEASDDIGDNSKCDTFCSENCALKKERNSLRKQVLHLAQKSIEQQEILDQLAARQSALQTGKDLSFSYQIKKKDIISRLNDISTKQETLRSSRSQLANSISTSFIEVNNHSLQSPHGESREEPRDKE